MTRTDWTIFVETVRGQFTQRLELGEVGEAAAMAAFVAERDEQRANATQSQILTLFCGNQLRYRDVVVA